jgi:CRISPR/Cas system CMR-associated protein Cmr1 (group 7 of RAMP superfamily)
MLESNDFEHYKYFIIVTKQHSAKYVIYKEFKDQITNKHLKYLRILAEEEQNKKYNILWF